MLASKAAVCIMRNLLLFLLTLKLTGLSLAFECPDYQYPYGGCSSCFTVNNQTSAFEVAARYCQDNGGTLISIANSSHFELLSHYLDGLSEERQLWVGYRYNNEGTRVDVNAEKAPAVILNNENFAGVTVGGQETCVAIQNSTFVSVECSQELPFLCMYTHGVPDVSLSPNEKVVFVPPMEETALSVTVVTPEASVVTAEWRLNGITISSDQPGFSVATQNGAAPSQAIFSLTIMTFDPALHVGTYELLVSSLAGTSVLATWQLKEMILGDITVQPQNLTIPQGQIAGFECRAEGARPTHSVTWYKDSNRLAENSHFFVSDVTGTLFIRDVESVDAGLYHCVCENGAGSETSVQAQLTVAADFQSITEPTILIQPRPLILMAGDPYNLECVGVLPSGLDISYRFFHAQSFFFTTPDLQFNYPAENGFPVFRIEEVTVEDSSSLNGCSVGPENVQDFSMISNSQSASLTVNSIAEITRLSARFQNGMETESNLIPIPSGVDITFQCNFRGTPAPTVTRWTWNGEPVDQGVVTEGTVSTLSVSGVMSGGVYQCHVENDHGRDTASVFICPEEQDALPGPVPFTAKPDTNTSLYISWGVPTFLSTHPLLLRYEVRVQQHLNSNTEQVFVHQPDENQLIVPGLLPGELYLVTVVARSLLGTGAEEEVLVRTFSNPFMEVVSGLRVQRTSDNSALVVRWDTVPMDTVAPVVPVYEVEYRVIGIGMGLSSTVERGEVLVIEELDNAASHEVRIRVLSQTRRDPAQFVPGPWSDFVAVAGITTLPTTEPSTQQSSQPATPTTGALLPPMNLLLIYVCVPVGVLLLVGVAVCLVVVCYCCYSRKRKNHYHPSKIERNSKFRSSEPSQRPMGAQVYDLPINQHTNQVWADNAGYAPIIGDPLPRNRRMSFEGVSDSELPAKRQKNVSTPASSTAPTPSLSVRSGTVTITYLSEDDSPSPSPIPTPEQESPDDIMRTKSEMDGSLNWNGASAHSSGTRSDTSSSGTRPQTWTPSSAITYSTNTTSVASITPPPTKDPFGYVYKETTSAAADLYKAAAEIEADLGISSYQLSDQYDSLEPPPAEAKEDLGTEGRGSPCNYQLDDIDFKVLNELAAESAALSSRMGTPDPYAYAPPPVTSDP